MIVPGDLRAETWVRKDRWDRSFYRCPPNLRDDIKRFREKFKMEQPMAFDLGGKECRIHRQWYSRRMASKESLTLWVARSWSLRWTCGFGWSVWRDFDAFTNDMLYLKLADWTVEARPCEKSYPPYDLDSFTAPEY